MKKTILGVVAITMLLVAILGVTVNAASITASEQGDVVTVTIRTNEVVNSMEFDLDYDSTKCEFVEDSITSGLTSIVTDKGSNSIFVSAMTGDTNTLSLQFRVFVKGEELPFTIKNTEFTKGADIISEAVAEPTVIVKVNEPAPIVPTPDDQINGEEGNKEPLAPEGDNNVVEGNNGEEAKAEETTTEYVDEEGNKIKAIPQTGSYLPSVALGVVVLGVIGVAGYKIIKNK